MICNFYLSVAISKNCQCRSVTEIRCACCYNGISFRQIWHLRLRKAHAQSNLSISPWLLLKSTNIGLVEHRSFPALDGRTQAELKSFCNVSCTTSIPTLCACTKTLESVTDLNVSLFHNRQGDYKLLEGYTGEYNGWYPVPGVDDPSAMEDEEPAPPSKELQLFNIKGQPLL